MEIPAPSAGSLHVYHALSYEPGARVTHPLRTAWKSKPVGGLEPMSPRELEAWLERLHEESFGWALNCCSGDRARAQDVLQSAYVRVISGRAVYAGRSLFRTWLFGVIRRVAIEEHRRVKTEHARTVVLEHPAARALAAEKARPYDFESARALHGALGLSP